MKLRQRNQQYWQWYWSVFRELIRRKYLSTFTVVVLSVSSIVTGFLAFMLPLKVIILAGSDRVPRYFAFFITDETKMDWIIGLTAGAIVCFVLTLLFDAITKKVSERAGTEVLAEANQLALASDQDKVVGSFYSKICSVQAGLIFGGLSMALLLLLHPVVFGLIVGLVTLEWLLSIWVVRGNDDHSPKGLKRYVLVRYKDYVSLLSNINFLIGFLVILVPYLLGDDRNIIISLISFLLLRRMLTVISSMVKTSIELEKNRQKINALLFRHHKVVTKHRSATLAMLDFLAKDHRSVFFNDALQQPKLLLDGNARSKSAIKNTADSTKTDYQVYWQDSTLKNFKTLFLWPVDKKSALSSSRLRDDKNGVVLQAQILSPKQAHLLDNEDLLFSFLNRHQVSAPSVISRFEQGKIKGQIVDVGTGEPFGGGWAELQARLFNNLWSIRPDDGLIDAYCATHYLLPDRINEELLKKVQLGVDTIEEVTVFDTFKASLEEIRTTLNRIPLYVHNDEITARNVVSAVDGSPIVVSWASWTLEPVGYEWPKKFRSQRPDGLARWIAEKRSNAPKDLADWELELPSLCRLMIRLVNRYQYKAALSMMGRICDLMQSHEYHADTSDDAFDDDEESDENQTDEAMS